jgi:hypothetical protein
MRRRQILIGTASLMALAPLGRLARAAAIPVDDGLGEDMVANESATASADQGVLRWRRERFPLPASASDATPAIPVSAKHSRWVLCPDDGKFYVFGGDYQSNWQGIQSGQNALLTYDPRTRIWEQAYPFWGKAGQHYPMHMDEVAVCWDSKRKVFWFTSGYQGGITGDERSKYIGIPTSGIVQTFDPVKRDWLVPFGPAKKQVHLALGGGQHMRSVYDAARDLILAAYWDGGFGTGLMEFNPSSGEYKRNRITGIGNWYPTNGATNHLIEGKLYCVGGRSGGTRDLAEFDTRTYKGLVLATFPADTYSDADFSYLPEIDAFLIWTEEPKAYLVNRKTGAISDGPPSPLLKDGTGYRPMHNNRHPSGVIVVGWNVSAAVQGKQLPEYWHYQLVVKSNRAWLPAGGNAKAITTDARGAPTNFLYDVRPGDYGNKAVYFGSGGVGIFALTRAWASAAYAKDLGPDGSMLFHCGGDGDYWGNEVYAFDFSTRRFLRLSEPSHAMTGAPTGPGVDPKKDPQDPRHFNVGECEHGPSVPEYGKGLLPAGTEPGAPHTYDGLVWIPGSVIGNKKGALVRPISSIVYTTRSTSRAHYFDLDVNKWGRLSANRIPFSPQTCVSGYDEEKQRIYHNYGYLELAPRGGGPPRQVSRRWSGIPFHGVGIFDPVRRLWLLPTNATPPDSAPGGINAIAVDSTTSAVPVSLAGAPWPKGLMVHGGIAYCTDLDCFFVYSQGNRLQGYAPQVIYRLQPPGSNPLSNRWTVTKITMNGDAVQNDPSGAGQYKRIQWIPRLQCFAIYNGHVANGRIYLYKPEGL